MYLKKHKEFLINYPLWLKLNASFFSSNCRMEIAIVEKIALVASS